MNSKNMTIAVLTVTAVALFCTLVLMHSSTGSVAWADTVDRGGDYVLVTGGFSNTDEALYVIDGLNDRLNVYQYDKNRNRIQLFDQANLQNYFVAR